MITGKKLFVLANVESIIDASNGDRKVEVTCAKKLVDNVELVGLKTAQLGQIQGYNLAFSVEVPRIRFAGEKYLYFDETVFEIKSLGKAKEPSKMLLHIQKTKDKTVLDAFERWI